jgi:hypothetical protein
MFGCHIKGEFASSVNKKSWWKSLAYRGECVRFECSLPLVIVTKNVTVTIETSKAKLLKRQSWIQIQWSFSDNGDILKEKQIQSVKASLSSSRSRQQGEALRQGGQSCPAFWNRFSVV